MNNLFLAFFCLLPWSAFLFKSIDIWHATGQFVQVGILILFSYSFFEKQKYIQPKNRSLGSFVCWAGLVTAYNWISVFFTTKHYPVKIFMPFFNLLCIILLYKLIVEYLDKGSIEKILKWSKYSIIVLLGYCVLQYLKLDEFFTGINSSGDKMVGTIGNTMHLAGLLAILQPLFFKKSRENILSLILIWLLIIATGSATGLVAGIAVILFCLWFKNKLAFIITSYLSFSLTIFLCLTRIEFFHNSDRFLIWGKTFKVIKDKFITGYGLGSFGAINMGTGFPESSNMHWQHLHNEYYQLVFEVGIIGLVLIAWCIYDYFKTFNSIRSDLTIRLASIFFGFCLLCGVTFFGHLWQTSVIGLLAFSSIYLIKNEVSSAD